MRVQPVSYSFLYAPQCITVKRVMNDGINLRWWLFKKLSERVPDLIITSIYVLYQIYLTGWIKFIIIFLIIFCIIFILIKSFQKRRLPEMVSKRWIMAEHWRQFVKMIVSKMEILQNNKEQFEIEKDNEILQTAFKSHIKINNWAWWIYRVWTIFSFILNIFICCFVIKAINSKSISFKKPTWFIKMRFIY